MKPGETLILEHGLSCTKGYYSRDGRFYNQIVDFPVALFDPNGYVIIYSESELRQAPFQYGIRLKVSGAGISEHPRYVRCFHLHG